VAPERLLVLGRVLGPRGLRGAVKVRSFAAVPALLAPGSAVILRGPGGAWEVSLTGVQAFREGLVVTFQGINSRARRCCRGNSVKTAGQKLRAGRQPREREAKLGDGTLKISWGDDSTEPR
jgi:ribosomal 30S subunit maturation factor RimM